MAGREPLDLMTTTVGDLCDRGLCGDAVAVGPEVKLGEIVEAAHQSPAVRTIAVVDADRKVLGVIPVRELSEAMFMDLFPGAALGEIGDLESALELAEGIKHGTAEELMSEPQTVARSENTHDAFIRIHRAHLTGVPIVDEADRLVGYLDNSALAPLWLEYGRPD